MCEARWCCFSVSYKSDVNVYVWCDLRFRKNSKLLSSSTISAEASFDDNSNKEVNVNKILSVMIEKKLEYKLSNIIHPILIECATENVGESLHY